MLTLADLPDRVLASLLDSPLTPSGLFGTAVDVMRAKFEATRKDREALTNLLQAVALISSLRAQPLRGQTLDPLTEWTSALPHLNSDGGWHHT